MFRAFDIVIFWEGFNIFCSSAPILEVMLLKEESTRGPLRFIVQEIENASFCLLTIKDMTTVKTIHNMLLQKTKKKKDTPTLYETTMMLPAY